MDRGIGIRPALWGTVFGAVVLVILAVAAAPARAAAGTFCDPSAYVLSLRSLTGPRGTGADLVIRVTTATADCELPQTLDAVTATIGKRTVQLQQVSASRGYSASTRQFSLARRSSCRARRGRCSSPTSS